MKKAVIFDLDGTLTNTSEDICNSINTVLNKYGYKSISVEETKKFVGNGARKLVERAIKSEKPTNFEDILKDYNDLYNFCGSPKTYVYDGLIEVLHGRSRKAVFRRSQVRLRIRSKGRRESKTRTRQRRNNFKGIRG